MNFDETFGAHMTAVAVEVEPETGQVHVLDAVLVSDCGVVINPTVVEGQHQGGFAQGLGAVLLEEVRYDADGQPLTSTLVDYTPRAPPMCPVLRVVHRETPSATEGGFRGVGEAAIIAAPAVIAGAVADALAPLGVEITSTRLHPHYLREAIRASGYETDAAAFACRCRRIGLGPHAPLSRAAIPSDSETESRPTRRLARRCDATSGAGDRAPRRRVSRTAAPRARRYAAR